MDKDGRQLSFGTESFLPDRYRVDHPYPRDWNLEILSVRTNDAGSYDCLIGTQPPIRKTVELVVQGNVAENNGFCDDCFALAIAILKCLVFVD